eukprot:SRR837773.5551.p2 GENE.SRR837773.5551~~SRR837773.5551.p2  ORF type:complete len:160 (-),score=62.01 SRR837773.5551:21-428(-)
MDVAWMFSLAVVLFLNAVFDAFVIAARLAHTSSPLVSAKLPWHANAVHALLIVGPALEFAGAVVCWKVYGEHMSSVGGEHAYLGQLPRSYYGAPDEADGHAFMGPQVLGGAAAPPGSRRGCSGFEAFQGQGHRLL